jgi:hypothetical protein
MNSDITYVGLSYMSSEFKTSPRPASAGPSALGNLLEAVPLR